MQMYEVIRRIKGNIRAITVLISAMCDPTLRSLIPEINKQRRSMYEHYESLPLPEFLADLTPDEVKTISVNRHDLRELIDAVARLDWLSPFGICLRRSLLRYYFLRRSGLALGIVFGVRIRQNDEPAGIAGHAWNILDGRPYHEQKEDYQGFTMIYQWPDPLIKSVFDEGGPSKSEQ
jgi:hypothetical protein